MAWGIRKEGSEEGRKSPSFDTLRKARTTGPAKESELASEKKKEIKPNEENR